MISSAAGRMVQWGVVATAFALTACGSGSPASSSTPLSSTPSTAGTPSAGAGGQTAGTFDFCQLVTSAEAQAAVGRPVKVGISTSEITVLGPGGGCVYASINFTKKLQTIVNVGFYGNRIVRSQFDQEVTSKVGAAGKPVSGLGETAIYIPGVVAVFDRGTALQIQIVKDNVPSTDIALMTKLARKALERSSEVR